MIASNAVYASLRREKRNRGFISRITSLLAIEEPAQWLDWDETDTETESNGSGNNGNAAPSLYSFTPNPIQVN